MKITHYEFGKIIIDNKIYTSDIKIVNDKIIPNWWRKEGHKLYLQDIEDIISAKPKILIVGCGANSVLEVSDEVKTFCGQQNIELYILNTYDAVKLFNKLYSDKKTTIAFCAHLTC